MDGKSKLNKALKKLEKEVGRLTTAGPLYLFERESLTPIDQKKLEILLLTIGFKNFNIKEMTERKRRQLFQKALRCRNLREQWANVYPAPKNPRQPKATHRYARLIENQMQQTVIEIRRGLNQS